jgi:hypothetical protein
VVEVADAVLALEITGEGDLASGGALDVAGALSHAGVGEYIADSALHAGPGISRAVLALLKAIALALVVVVADETVIWAPVGIVVLPAISVATAIVAFPVVAFELILVAFGWVLPFEATFACVCG